MIRCRTEQFGKSIINLPPKFIIATSLHTQQKSKASALLFEIFYGKPINEFYECIRCLKIAFLHHLGHAK
jgi:hypothetical protein